MELNKKTETPPEGGTQNASLLVEAVDDTGPLAGQVFHILDRDVSQLVSLTSFRGIMSAVDVIRTQAVKFVVTDEEGRAEVTDLKPGTYFICGVNEPNGNAWNVKAQLEPGKNSLKLDGGNMAAAR